MEKISRGELETICIKISRGREQQRGKRKKQQFWFREEQKQEVWERRSRRSIEKGAAAGSWGKEQ